MDKETIVTRLMALRGRMNELGVQAFVLRDVANIAWLTGFDGVFDDERAHTMIVTADKALLHTDSRYEAALRAAARPYGHLFTIDAAAGVSPARFVQLELGRSYTIQAKVARKDTPAAAEGGETAPAGRPDTIDDAEKQPALKPFAIEDDITLAEFRALEKTLVAQTVPPLETHGVVKWLRSVKTPEEIARLRKAQQITDDTFEHIKDFVKPGMTERDVRMEMEDFMAWSGAEGLAFATIVAAGPNSAKPHSVPGDTKLQAGQVLLLDFGAKAQGYCSDMTRCIFLGEPSAPVKHMYEVVVEANETVEAMLKPGVTGIEAHQKAEQVLASAGFAGCMGHGLGHGVGIEVHEEPCLNLRNDKPLIAGNVVTVEPGIYLPQGRNVQINIPMAGAQSVPLIPPMGIRVEDCGVITDNGFSVFTQTPHDIVII